MKTHSTFEKMIKEQVLPLRKIYANSSRLDGHNGENGRKPFSYFKYKGKKWRVNSDTRIKELLKAYNFLLEGINPFIETKTRGGNSCLVLKEEYANRPKHLYIYLVSS